jgi:hypothetical protein
MKVLEQGTCPICDEGLNYHGSEPEGESIKYHCHCPGCGWSGEEWYELRFTGFIDESTGEAIEGEIDTSPLA